MHQNIKNKFSRELDSKLYNANYYDFMLYKGETNEFNGAYLDDITIADFSDLIIEKGRLYSSIYWSGSTNSGVEMEDIGLTGMDNGFICFNKDRISNRDFMCLFLRSTYEIESGDTRLFMTPITGNTQIFEYPMYLTEDDESKYLAFKGGFYQGFFKLDGFDYQVLPHNINRDLVLHFDIRPRTDYDVSMNTVNYLHPENNGIFFFMGTRAENKFWQVYNVSENMKDGFGKKDIGDEETCDEFYEGDYDREYFLKDDEYMRKDLTVDINKYSDSDGHELTKRGYYDIDTDNKFLLFDHTEEGFTVDTWVEGTKARLYGRQDWDNINLFPLMNHTETGYTVDCIEELYEKHQKEFDVYKDIRDNVFALRITDCGAIGYRYGVLNCDEDNENKYEVVEEYSKDGIINMNEWNSVNVRFAVLNPSYDKCDNKRRKMKIMIYVNGFLVFISKELDTLRFKALDDVYQKQEAVPYSISLGGGTQGLLETIMPRYYDISNYVLPIERDFCGTFIGDIKSFKMYLGFIDYSTIKNYLSLNKTTTIIKTH